MDWADLKAGNIVSLCRDTTDWPDTVRRIAIDLRTAHSRGIEEMAQHNIEWQRLLQAEVVKIRPAALEEAAKVARNTPGNGLHVADAIRALK